MYTFAVLTCSATAFSGKRDDTSGKILVAAFEALGFALTHHEITPDDPDIIATKLSSWSDDSINLILTTGGTGPAARDVTPEATEGICDRMLPGFGEEMRRISLGYVPTAVLSRQTAGIRGKCLVINLPGSPRSIREILEKIFASIPYCVDLIGGPYIDTNPEIIKSYRPKK